MPTFGHNASQAKDDAHARSRGLDGPGVKAAAKSLAIADLACDHRARGDGQAFTEGGVGGRQCGCIDAV